jgi:hypothetical protein
MAMPSIVDCSARGDPAAGWMRDENEAAQAGALLVERQPEGPIPALSACSCHGWRQGVARMRQLQNEKARPTGPGGNNR